MKEVLYEVRWFSGSRDNCLNCPVSARIMSSVDLNTALHITLLSHYIPFTGKHEPNILTCSQLCDFIAQLVRALHRHRRGHGLLVSRRAKREGRSAGR